MLQRREIAQLKVLIALDVVNPADGRHQLRLLNRINPEVRFQIQLQVQHVFGIAGLLDHQCQDGFLHRIVHDRFDDDSRDRCRSRSHAFGFALLLLRRFGLRFRQVGTLAIDEADDMLQRREIPQLEILIALDVVDPTDGRHQLRLFDRINPEVGLEIQSRSSMSLG